MSILATTRLPKRAMTTLATLAVAAPVTLLDHTGGSGLGKPWRALRVSGGYRYCYPLPHMEDLPENTNRDLDISAFSIDISALSIDISAF